MAYPEELSAAFPGYGPDCDKAVNEGVDVSLLFENLRLSPWERIRKMEALLKRLNSATPGSFHADNSLIAYGIGRKAVFLPWM